ncbi:MAG: tRNA (uridine(54)-C5)-methyltransferase TrmA [Halioglobus sp.]|nr:tRNA (uridine(54)-C5)-methyltransferase TrmA [Halioglobus sp.]
MPLSHVKPAHYETLLKEKVDRVRKLLAPFSPPKPAVYPSPPEGFRLRAEFRVWHDGEKLDYVMFRKSNPRTPVSISTFPIATTSIQILMPILLDSIKACDTLRRKLFQIEFLASLTGDMVVTLVYHRTLDAEWETTAEALIDQLAPTCPSLSLVGRSRRQKLVLGHDFVQEVLQIGERRFSLRQYEQAFTQPNGVVNVHMIEWACTQAANLGDDLLELYCGNGNFTLPLSKYFNRILATEVAKTSIHAARLNLEENGISNVQLVRMSAADVARALHGERRFRRLAALPTPLGDYTLSTLFVDPPRKGLEHQTIILAARFTNIFYISCNPSTLADNLKTLCKSHKIGGFALFDQFPYTEHMECGVLLNRRQT